MHILIDNVLSLFYSFLTKNIVTTLTSIVSTLTSIVTTLTSIGTKFLSVLFLLLQMNRRNETYDVVLVLLKEPDKNLNSALY